MRNTPAIPTRCVGNEKATIDVQGRCLCSTYVACHMKVNGKKCHQISKINRANIGKLIEAVFFDNKSGTSWDKPTTARTPGGGIPTKQKGSTVNPVVKEEDGGEETEVKEDGMGTRKHLF